MPNWLRRLFRIRPRPISEAEEQQIVQRLARAAREAEESNIRYLLSKINGEKR